MVFANVTPVRAWLRSLNRGGAPPPADRRPQLSTATIGRSVPIERSESRSMSPENLTLAVGGGGGYHSVRVRTLSSRGAETWCSRARVLLADELPQAVSVRRRTARAYVLCRLPHVSGAGTAGQEHLANGRLAGNGPASGRACEVVVRRNVPGSGDARP